MMVSLTYPAPIVLDASEHTSLHAGLFAIYMWLKMISWKKVGITTHFAVAGKCYQQQIIGRHWTKCVIRAMIKIQAVFETIQKQETTLIHITAVKFFYSTDSCLILTSIKQCIEENSQEDATQTLT